MMRWRITGLLLACVVLIADQLSKWWIINDYLKLSDTAFTSFLMQKAPQYDFVSHKITSFLNIVMVWNPGVSFGLLQSAQSYVAHGLTILAFVIACGFMFWLWRMPTAIRAWAIGLIVGGAIGNVWDRLRFGAVADFIDVHVAGYHWPAFNVADAAICVGVAVLLYEAFILSPAQSLTEK